MSPSSLFWQARLSRTIYPQNLMRTSLPQVFFNDYLCRSIIYINNYDKTSYCAIKGRGYCKEEIEDFEEERKKWLLAALKLENVEEKEEYNINPN